MAAILDLRHIGPSGPTKFVFHRIPRIRKNTCNVHRYINITAPIVQELYDFSRNKLQQKVSQRFLVNRGVLYDILKV